MRLGILTDPHLVPEDHATDGDMARYRSALRHCVREGVDGLALLGDLSGSGDAASLEAGLRLAARTKLTVWVVSGNHDLGEREDALAEAVRRVGAHNIRLATPAGEAFDGGGIRVAGLCAASDNYGYTTRSDQRPDVLYDGTCRATRGGKAVRDELYEQHFPLGPAHALKSNS